VTPGIHIERVDPATSEVLHHLWQLYRHNLSEFRGMLPEADGRFSVRGLHAALDNPDEAVYLFLLDERPAGFAFVKGLLGDERSMAEFFVVRAARRRHVGSAVAMDVMARFPGRWRFAFQEENPAAAHFWRRMAEEIGGGDWSEERLPVPGKPHIAPDTWISCRVPGAPDDSATSGFSMET
jgi:predicted acetyltransferase